MALQSQQGSGLLSGPAALTLLNGDQQASTTPIAFPAASPNTLGLHLVVQEVYVQAVPVTARRLGSLSRAVRAYLAAAEGIQEQLARMHGWSIETIVSKNPPVSGLQSRRLGRGSPGLQAGAQHFVLVYERPRALLSSLDLSTSTPAQRRQLAVDMVRSSAPELGYWLVLTCHDGRPACSPGRCLSSIASGYSTGPSRLPPFSSAGTAGWPSATFFWPGRRGSRRSRTCRQWRPDPSFPTRP